MDIYIAFHEGEFVAAAATPEYAMEECERDNNPLYGGIPEIRWRMAYHDAYEGTLDGVSEDEYTIQKTPLHGVIEETIRGFLIIGR